MWSTGLAWVAVTVVGMCGARDIFIDWKENPADNPITSTYPLIVRASRNDTLEFVYDEDTHTVFQAQSVGDLASCSGVQLCPQSQTTCSVPLDDVVGDTAWYFCQEHCPFQNLVVRIFNPPTSYPVFTTFPSASPSAAPSTAPSAAPSAAPSTSPSAAPSTAPSTSPSTTPATS
ncbi:hypothetical protein BASA81_005528 [Batrachochytrium salamandrivorans]|nr:hypothetical protein BASA81_005528 [Batrachochytrium salamandrivorans]